MTISQTQSSGGRLASKYTFRRNRGMRVDAIARVIGRYSRPPIQQAGATVVRLKCLYLPYIRRPTCKFLHHQLGLTFLHCWLVSGLGNPSGDVILGLLCLGLQNAVRPQSNNLSSSPDSACDKFRYVHQQRHALCKHPTRPRCRCAAKVPPFLRHATVL